MSPKTEVVIIGGGASGLVAALCAARAGAAVTVLERMKRVGRKLLATGNGRCNLTNTDLAPTHYHGAPVGLVASILAQFDPRATLTFFQELGIEPAIEPDGLVFPASYQAGSVLDVLRHECGRLGVKEVCDHNANQVLREKHGFVVRCTNNAEFRADRVLLCAGGKATPNLGSNGGGFKIAKTLGHTLIEPFPALVQVCLDAPWLKRLSGLKIDARVSVQVDGATQRTETGEFLFADYGVSGPPILQLSRIVGEHAAQKPVHLCVDLFPEKSEDEVAKIIGRRVTNAPDRDLVLSFVGWLHKRLIPVVLNEAGIEDHRAAASTLTPDQIARIARVLKAWEMRCTGTQSWMQAQVTAGGVDLREIDPVTMESRKTPGVYMAGEVLDVDGDCGGYNLQWAWTTGILAGRGATGPT